MPDTFEEYDFGKPKKKSFFTPSTFTSDPYEQEVLQKIADASSGAVDSFKSGAGWLNENIIQPQWRGQKAAADFFFRQPLDEGLSAEAGKAAAEKVYGYSDKSRNFRGKLANIAGSTVGLPFGAGGQVIAKHLIAPEDLGEEVSQQTVPANLAGAAVPFLRGWMSKGVDLGVSAGQGAYGLWDAYNAKSPAERRAALLQVGLAIPGVVSPGTGAKPKSVGSVTKPTVGASAAGDIPTSSVLDEAQVNNALDESKSIVPDRFRESRATNVQNISAPSQAEIDAFLANRPGEIPQSTPEGPAVAPAFGDSPTARMIAAEEATRRRMRMIQPTQRGAMSLFPSSMSPEMKADVSARNAGMSPESWELMYRRQFGDQTPEFPASRWNEGLDENTSMPDEALTNDIMSEVQQRAGQGIIDDEMAAFGGRVRNFQNNQLNNDILSEVEMRANQPSNAVDINDILNQPRGNGAPVPPDLPREPGIPPMGESWVDRVGPYPPRIGPQTVNDAFVPQGPPVPPSNVGGGDMMGGPGRGNMYDQLEQNGFGIGEPLEQSQPSPYGYEGGGDRATGGNMGATEDLEMKLMEAIYNGDAAAEAHYRNLIEGGSENGPTLSLVDEGDIQNNASGDSSASVEAMNRLRQMSAQGKQFVVYDRAGRMRPLLATDAVDYNPKPGETFGIQGPDGFQTLTDNGGRAPRPAAPLPRRMGIPDDRMSGNSFDDEGGMFSQGDEVDPRFNEPPPNWMPDEPVPPQPNARGGIETNIDDAEPLPTSRDVEFTETQPLPGELPPTRAIHPADLTPEKIQNLKDQGYTLVGRNNEGDIIFNKQAPPPVPKSAPGRKKGEVRVIKASNMTAAVMAQNRRRGNILTQDRKTGDWYVTPGGKPENIEVLETEVGNIRPTAGRGERQAAGQRSAPQSPLGALGGPPAIPDASGGPPPLPPRGPSNGPPGGRGGPPELPPGPQNFDPNIPPDLPETHPTTGKPLKPPTVGDYVADVLNISRTTLSSGDASAAFRQGIGLVTKPAFWKHLATTYPRSIFSEKYAQAYDAALRKRALFRPRVLPNGRMGPSFAKEAGLFIADLNHEVGKFTGREESMVSNLAERTPGLGKVVRGSNRGYTNFLNHVRADVFESLVKDSNRFGVNALHDIDYARKLADFVNTVSGRGSLNIKIMGKEFANLEPAAKALSATMFSPRLIASRMRMLNMLNPVSYAFRPPQLRREALKSLFGIAAFGATMTTLGKMAGGEVGTDPDSSDFGKIKVGNTRFDPYGGLQQWAVFSSRMMSGRYKSSNPDIEAVDLDNPEGPYDPNRMDIALRFARGKVHPMIGLAWSILSAQKEMSGRKMKFNTMDEAGMDKLMENALMQRFIPLLAQDVYEVYKNEPDIVPAGIAAIFGGLGGGVQSYGGREEFNEDNTDFTENSSFEEDDFQ